MASGWWDNNGAITGCVAAYQAIGVADLATSYVNLQNPGTNNAAPGVAPTFATLTGWTFNGSTQYLTTGVVPAAGYSAIVRFSGVGAPSTNAPVLGSGNTGAANGFQMNPVAGALGGTSVQYVYGNGFQTLVPQFTSGVIGITPLHDYIDGGENGATGGTFSGAGQALYIGARNNGGTADRFLPGSIQAVAIYSTTLTTPEMATLAALMNALSGALGQPAAVRGVLVPGMNRDGRRIGASRIGWG